MQTGEGLGWGRLGWAGALLLILFQVLVTLQPRWFYRSLLHSLTLSLTHSFTHSLFYSSVCTMLIKSPQTPPFPDVLLVVPNLRISCSAMQISCSITHESLTASVFARSLLTAFPLSPEQSTLMVYWFTRMVSVTNSPFSNSPFLFFPSFYPSKHLMRVSVTDHFSLKTHLKGQYTQWELAVTDEQQWL